MRLLRAVGEITYEAWCTIRYIAVSNLYNVAVCVSFALPYVMYLMGQDLALERGYMAFGGEVFVPLIVGALVYYAKELGNRANKGKRVPVPSQRFTTVDEYGEVSIPNDRLNELILFIADYEDWLTKRGML